MSQKGVEMEPKSYTKPTQYHKKGAAMTQNSVISTSITQEYMKQEVRPRALPNCTCNAQWRA